VFVRDPVHALATSAAVTTTTARVTDREWPLRDRGLPATGVAMPSRERPVEPGLGLGRDVSCGVAFVVEGG